MTPKLLLSLILLVSIGSSAMAQIDQGAPDTLIMETSVIPDATTNQKHLQLDVYMFNDVNKAMGISVGFGWDNPAMHMDSAQKSLISKASFDNVFLLDGSSIDLTNQNQRFLFSGFTFGSRGLLPSNSRQLLASYFFTLDQWSTNDLITVDTLEYDDGSAYMVIDIATQDAYIPVWSGQLVIRDSAYSVPSNLAISTESLQFNSTAGGGPPPAQQFRITSDNDPLQFSLDEAAFWLIKSPAQGTTPADITVSINPFGLSAGQYTETIIVSSDRAANSPQEIEVTLIVAPPPAEIAVSHSNFHYNAVVDGDNPAPQSFEITNVGGQPLNWSVSNARSWLSLDPVSGVNTGTVTLAIDITGLATGDYRDTVWVSDPNAANSPVPVAITLSVASGLPEIGVTEASNFILVDLPPDGSGELNSAPPLLDLAPVTITVLNVGGGVMNFQVVSNSWRFKSVSPKTGVAPQEVTVEFNMAESTPPGDYYDTLWIQSDEAINSPFPVAFHFYAVPYPAKMTCNKDTLFLQVHECLNGTRLPTQGAYFRVDNIGGDDPMQIELEYDSRLFTTNETSASAPSSFTVIPLDAGLAVGTYFDTLWVKAPKAINGSHMIEIRYEVLPTEQAPEIDDRWASDLTQIAVHEGSEPFYWPGFAVYNLHYGCMDWRIERTAVWAVPTVASGKAGELFNLIINPTRMGRGSYPDTIIIVAPEAVEPVLVLPITLNIWRDRGDCNQDGKINLIDITSLINFVYLGGPSPWPIPTVGDVNCDGKVNLADITFLIQFVYLHGQPPCDDY